jgi:hypothetical protein
VWAKTADESSIPSPPTANESTTQDTIEVFRSWVVLVGLV